MDHVLIRFPDGHSETRVGDFRVPQVGEVISRGTGRFVVASVEQHQDGGYTLVVELSDPPTPPNPTPAAA